MFILSRATLPWFLLVASNPSHSPPHVLFTRGSVRLRLMHFDAQAILPRAFFRTAAHYRTDKQNRWMSEWMKLEDISNELINSFKTLKRVICGNSPPRWGSQAEIRSRMTPACCFSRFSPKLNHSKARAYSVLAFTFIFHFPCILIQLGVKHMSFLHLSSPKQRNPP